MNWRKEYWLEANYEEFKEPESEIFRFLRSRVEEGIEIRLI